MASQKLENIFNTCADKLVDANEVAAYMARHRNERFSIAETTLMDLLNKSGPTEQARVKKAMADITATGDLYKGDKGRIFLTVSACKTLIAISPLTEKFNAELSGRIDDFIAEALENALDYNPQKQALGLKRVRP